MHHEAAVNIFMRKKLIEGVLTLQYHYFTLYNKHKANQLD